MLIRLVIVALLALTLQVQANPSPGIVSAGQTCSPGDWVPPAHTGASGVQALLKDVGATTRWADVPIATKDRLKALAEDRLAAFRSRWGEQALESKLKILLDCPAPEMSIAIDEYYRISFKGTVPERFTLESVKNAELRRALVHAYLLAYATSRTSLTYPNAMLPNRDWDGKSRFDSTLLPDKQAYEAWKRHAAGLTAFLKGIDEASLDSTERALRRQSLFRTRALAQGGLFGDSFGGSDPETACELVSMDNAVLMGYKGDKGRPTIFAHDDEVLREVNATYLNNIELKWLDKGTAESAIKNRLCYGPTDEDISEYVGSIADSEVAKGIKLLKAWAIERILDDPRSQAKCTVYSNAERASIWESFSADQQFNNDGSSTMETYRSQVSSFAAEKRVLYRAAARLAVEKVFADDAVLTPAQRVQVMAAIDQENAFGLMPRKVAEFLDAAQGQPNGRAAQIWNEAIRRHVKRLGGYGPDEALRTEDEAAVRTMFDQVREWVSKRYKGYPIETSAVFPLFKFKLTTGGNATTNTATGDIDFGIGTNRSLMEYYSILIHEIRHAVTAAWRAHASDPSLLRQDEGAAIEGSGVAVEELLLEAFMRETLNDDLAFALYSLDYGTRDARFAGTTDATLSKYFRPDCSHAADPDTIAFTKAIADEYGLTGALADTVALRAHAGTQYFQYISGGLQVLADIAFLQSQMEAAKPVRLDPFVLFACNLNTPQRDPRYVAELKACISTAK